MRDLDDGAPSASRGRLRLGRKQNAALIADESFFGRQLALERKRSERTGDPFALMILDIAQLNGDAPARKIAKMCAAMRGATRDTDQYGWYTYPTAIGGLFPALRDGERVSVETALAAKTGRALQQVLDPEDAKKVGMSFHFYPEDFPADGPGYRSNRLLYPDLARRDKSRPVHRLVKRCMDIVGSLAGLLLFSPAFLIIPILIRLTSPGPAFYRQRRVGRYGREFDFLKFRTMQVNNDAQVHEQYVRKLIHSQVPAPAPAGGAKPVYKIVNDPRVTRIGRFLRRSSLDELPQILNVIAGQMSLVGPRPRLPDEVRC